MNALQPGSRARPVAVAVVIAVTLVGVGALVAVALANRDRAGSPPPRAERSAGVPASAASGPESELSEGAARGDLGRYRAGDCMTIERGTNTVRPATCDAPDAFTVLLKKTNTVEASACDGTDATNFLASDEAGKARDFVLCVAPARRR